MPEIIHKRTKKLEIFHIKPSRSLGVEMKMMGVLLQGEIYITPWETSCITQKFISFTTETLFW